MQTQSQNVNCPACGDPVIWRSGSPEHDGSRVLVVCGVPCCGQIAVAEIEFSRGQIRCSTTFKKVK